MQQHGNMYFGPDPSSRPLGPKGRIKLFSEHGHVAYQIKWTHESNNMVTTILPRDPLDPGGQNSFF